MIWENFRQKIVEQTQILKNQFKRFHDATFNLEFYKT